MKELLHSLKVRIAVLLVASLFIYSRDAQAANEDSCLAMMLINPDNNDPLLIHFSFIGNVPINSFQFLGLWDFGDGNFSTDSCPDHTYSQPGTYVVCLSFSICIGGGLSCHDDTCESITVGTMASVEGDESGLHKFYTYPNPVVSEFRLRSDSNKEMVVNIKDISGRTVFSGIVKNDSPIDATGFSNGIYFIEAGSEGHILKRKMVVQK